MPTSHYRQIPLIIEATLAINPASIIEVGIGCGKYGALLREYLTVWDHYFEPWESRKLIMDGIEIHDLYRSSPAWACYDNVAVGDARLVVPTLGAHYDMALMVDVLEHFTPAHGAALLGALLDKASAILIGLPAVYAPTVKVWDNPHEIHLSGWTAADLEALGMDVEVVHDDGDSRIMVARTR
jgi:hypothetical protein